MGLDGRSSFLFLSRRILRLQQVHSASKFSQGLYFNGAKNVSVDIPIIYDGGVTGDCEDCEGWEDCQDCYDCSSLRRFPFNLDHRHHLHNPRVLPPGIHPKTCPLLVSFECNRAGTTGIENLRKNRSTVQCSPANDCCVLPKPSRCQLRSVVQWLRS